MATGSPHRETARHRDAFECWFEHQRSTPKASERLRVCERVLREWATRYGWHDRADQRDAEAAAIADREAVQRRAEMLKRHRQAGELLVRRGIERFAQKGDLARIETARDATSAIRVGIEIERTADGLPTWVTRILTADLPELERMKRELLAAGDPEPADDELRRMGYADMPKGRPPEE